MQYMRNRYYDPGTGRFTQEDPIGLAGGMNLYGFASGDPVNFSDPLGLCKGPKKTTRPCRVELSPYGVEKGAKLSDLTAGTLKNLQALADKVDADLGLNATKNGTHIDPGHAAGTAVDIGTIDGKSIGDNGATAAGMLEPSKKVQQAAADMGGLTDTGNLGPAGKFNGATGPKPIIDNDIRKSHENHIHLSYAKP